MHLVSMGVNSARNIIYTLLFMLAIMVSMPLSAARNVASRYVTRARLVALCDTALVVDTLSSRNVAEQSSDTVTPKKNKDAIDAPVRYVANDSMVWTRGGNANLYHHQLAESVLVSARPRAWNFVQTASAVCLPGGDPHPEPACPVRRGQNLDVTSSSEEMTHQAVSLAPEPPCFFLSSSALRAECQLAFQPSAWPLRPVLLARKLKNENL